MLIQAVPARAGSSRRSTRRLIWPLAVLVAVPAMLAGLSTAAIGAVGARQAVAGPGAPATTAVPSYCQSGGPKLWNNLAICGWPSPDNTGPDLANCLDRKLVPVGNGTSAIVLNTPNQVVSCEKLQGPVLIQAANVTIKDSMVETKHGTGASGSAAITIDVGASATITHVAVDGGNSVHACIWHQGLSMIVDAVNCYGSNDGIFAWNPTVGTSTQGSNYSISNSYFHDFTKATANGHDDGFQTEGSSHGFVNHNTYRMTTNSTSAIAIWDSRADSNDITVSNNLIAGGGFSVYAEDYNPGDGAPGNPSQVGGFSVTNILFEDNSFSTILSGCVGKYGVWFTRTAWPPYYGGPTDGWHRLGNVVLETGQNIDNTNPSSDGHVCS